VDTRVVGISSRTRVEDLERLARRLVARGSSVVFSAPADNDGRVRQIKRLAGRISADTAGLMFHIGKPEREENIYLVVAPATAKWVWFGEPLS
jgi:hypothetical protein